MPNLTVNNNHQNFKLSAERSQDKLKVKTATIDRNNYLMNLEDFYVDKLEKSCRKNFDSFILDDGKLDSKSEQPLVLNKSSIRLRPKSVLMTSQVNKNLLMNTKFN